VKGWLWVDDGSGPCPDWATPYEDAVKSAVKRTRARWGRSGDDLYMLYTGGTTGMPKGVMWRQDDLFAKLIDGGVRHYDVNGGVEGVRATLTASPSGVTLMPACPLMHGTGAFTANTTLAEGGRVCLLESRKYDPVELLDTVEREKVNGLVIVGDPFSRPLLAALDERPGHWDLSSLMMMISSGAMWSEPVKQRLLAHHPNMLLVDAFSSSEALGMGMSVSGGGSSAKTASFTLAPDVKVLKEDGRPVEPGSDEVGVLALGGRNPLGYYKDEEKSDRTFKVIDGVRFSIPGDYAQVDADGTIHVLGRGSVCINSGGEKIFPEEVEEALKTHTSVHDAVVVGIPHETYGEQIVAVVELVEAVPGDAPSEAELIEHVKGRLASYKAPRRVRCVATIGRAPNGKVDYNRHRAESKEELGAAAAG
jgi:fatty-acyl-CoA synthase